MAILIRMGVSVVAGSLGTIFIPKLIKKFKKEKDSADTDEKVE